MRGIRATRSRRFQAAAFGGLLAVGAGAVAFAARAEAAFLASAEVERDGVGGADALDGAVVVATSPDGQQLYVGSAIDNAITVFARDAESGALEPIQELREGIGGVDGLEAVFALATSPDGAHLYAGGYVDDAIAVFARDPGTGALAYVETVSDGGGFDPFLDGVQALAISEDGLAVYAVARNADAINVFARDPGTGQLTHTQTVHDGAGGVSSMDGPVSIALHPDGYDAYVVSQTDAVLLQFRIGAGGALAVPVATPLVAGPGLTTPQLVLCPPDGNHVYVSDSGRNAIFAYEHDPADGSLGLVQIAGDGRDDFVGLGLAIGLAFHPQGTVLYATGGAEDAVVALARNDETGLLRPLGVRRGGEGLPGLDGPALLAASPDGRHLYVSAAQGDAVFGFAVPHLRFAEAHVDGVGGADGLDGARTPVASPDGRHVYVASPAESAVALFARDPGSGALAFVEAIRDGVGGVDGLAGAADVAPSPDGLHLYVAGASESALAVFARDEGDGTLAPVQALRDGVGGVSGLDGVREVAVSPDGAHVYATSPTDSAVAIFARDPETGTLAFVEAIADGDPGVAGLGGAFGIALDAGGAHVYVGGALDDALMVFARDALTGALAPAQHLQQGSGGVELDGPGAVAVSGDGRHVYVAATGFSNSGVAVFDRDSGDGTLLFLDRATLEPFADLASAFVLRSIALAPDGTRLYATSLPTLLGFGPEGYVTIFAREPVSGRLDRVARYADGVGGFGGMTRPDPLAVTPDGRHLLVPGSTSDSLAVLAVPEPSPRLAGAAACVALAAGAAARRRRRVASQRATI